MVVISVRYSKNSNRNRVRWENDNNNNVLDDQNYTWSQTKQFTHKYENNSSTNNTGTKKIHDCHNSLLKTVAEMRARLCGI